MPRHSPSFAFVRTFLAALLVSAAALPPARGAATLDATFAPVLAAPASVTAAVAMPDGRVIVAGTFTTIDGAPAKRLARLTAAGTLDATFRIADDIRTDRIDAIAVQADGKVLLGGQLVRYGETSSQNYLFRLNADGSRDATFDAGGYVYGSAASYGIDNVVRAIAIDASGRIVVGGDFSSPRPRIARLTATGALDPTFDPAAGPDNAVTHIAFQSTGRLVIGGAFGAVNGVAKMNVARLEATGALDAAAFGTGVGTGHLAALAVQADDRVLVGGTFQFVNGVAMPLMARFGADGVLETSFTPAVQAYYQAVTSLATSGDRILVGGWYTFIIFNGQPTDHAARVFVLQQSDGVLVNSVSFAGKPTDTWALAWRPDGTVVVAGSFTQRDDGTQNLVAGLGLLSGESFGLDAGWRPVAGGQAEVRALARQADGRIVAAGDFYLAGGQRRNGLARFDAAGTFDATLVPPAVEGGVSTGVVVHADGRLVVGGTYYRVAATDNRDLALLSATGAYEAGSYAGMVNALAAYPGDKVVAALAHSPGVRRAGPGMALEDAGTFNPGTGISNAVQPDFDLDRVNAVAVQPDGKVIVAGSFSTFNGVARQDIVRLNADGTPDGSFASPAFTVFSFRHEIFAVAVQGDGRIVIAGRFSTVGGLARPTVARLNADGTVDATFTAPFADQGSTAYALAIQPDGKIVVGGSMQVIVGAAIYNSLVRLNADGSRDTTFNASLTGTVRSVLVAALPGGLGLQILAGGAFEAADGVARQGLARYLEGFDAAADADGDGIPNGVELAEGTNPVAKDNDVFANARLFAMQQYRDFLNREGDAGGIASWSAWISGGGSRAAAVEGFFASAEFQGTISPVARLYFAYFQRIPDYAGLQFWIGFYKAGNPLATISQAFAGSAEFVARYGALDNTQFVTLVYQNVLGRAPDAAGLAFWVGQLAGGMTRGTLMTGFSESAEYVAAIRSDVNVTMTYVGMLRRAPDDGGFAYWVGYLDQGQSVQALINAFLGAPEYRARFLP